MSRSAHELRQEILRLVGEYSQAAFPAQREFIPGVTPIPVSGRVFDAAEVRLLVDSGLDFWLTTGRFAAQFEKAFAQFCKLRHAILVNSGSSANLLAVAALASPELGERRLRPGDEVITVAAGFPTTVNALLQNRLTPVFVDVELPTYNIDVRYLEAALSERTRAIVLAHTLGNPFDLARVSAFARQHDLWLVEDCCDALGATYQGSPVGAFGQLATVSFYPAHHITMGEGGCVLTDDSALKKLVESFRDWGRDCWCEPGHDNTCGKRFDWQLGELPEGYDHKYVYSHIGYNMKATDMQAAVGLAQMEKLPEFIQTRRRNFHVLLEGLADLEEFFLLPEPTPNSQPSWFGFPLAVRHEAPFDRRQVLRYLEERKIGTRLLFGGNLTRQPAYRDAAYRIASPLTNTDFVMERVFWIGVYPGISPAMLDFVIESFHSLCQAWSHA
ncbi:MAG: lipopolysaccharide biosynthesis protein RfbH [Anaerolineales bacterium]|nr:lipopolysaccharide biosynthesis protein RfbH [Anaerolineales bacterium]